MIVEIQECAKKDLKKIDKSIAMRILKNIKKLEKYPNISNIKYQKIKKLKNHYPPHRYRR